jgi:hypothetical protein
MSRLVNILAAPGEVFEQVAKAKPSVGNWLVPVLLACVVGVASVWVMFSQPGVQQQLQERQARQYEKLVQEGKLKAEDVEKIQERMGQMGITIIKISGSFGAVATTFAWLFLMALVLWLLGRWGLKAPFPYLKAVEVAGLSLMIGVLGSVVTTLLIVIKGSMLVSLGPALLIDELQPDNKVHLLLLSVNVMTLWYLGVMAVGLAKLAGSTWLKPALWLYGLWAVLRLGIVFSGLGTQGM